MNTNKSESKSPLKGVLSLVIGFTLIAIIGTLAQPNGILKGDWLAVLPVLGLGVLVWGLWKRRADPIFLGCVLSGIGWRAILISPQFQVVPEEEAIRLFLFALGTSFALTTLLTGLFTEKPRWWATGVGVLLVVIAVFLF